MAGSMYVCTYVYVYAKRRIASGHRGNQFHANMCGCHHSLLSNQLIGSLIGSLPSVGSHKKSVKPRYGDNYLVLQKGDILRFVKEAHGLQHKSRAAQARTVRLREGARGILMIFRFLRVCRSKTGPSASVPDTKHGASSQEFLSI